jgi:hypothetical protein
MCHKSAGLFKRRHFIAMLELRRSADSLVHAVQSRAVCSRANVDVCCVSCPIGEAVDVIVAVAVG